MLHKNVRYIEDATFEVSYNPQTEWKWLITIAFFCGELGAGLFLVSLFVTALSGGSDPGVMAKLAFWAGLLGWLIVAGPKNLAHLVYLGQPWRFWRGLSRPGRSWITRGFYATFSLCGFGMIYLWLYYDVAFGGASLSPIGQFIMVIAGFAAFVVMIYDGIVLTYSPSIPLWNNSLIPVMRTSYAIMGGVTLTLLVSMIPGLGVGFADGDLHLWEMIERAFVIANMLMIAVYVMTLTYQVSAAKESAFLMIRDKYPAIFWGGVVGIGLVAMGLIPILLGASLELLLAVAIFELIGDFCILFLLLRVGVFSPLMPRPNIDVSLFSKG